MEELHPVIADIQTTDLLYYDETFREQCLLFCNKRDIDCLPTLDHISVFYLRNNERNDFGRRSITNDRRIEASTFIFRPDLLSRFERHPLLFVFATGELRGVVHFSDYNRTIVNTFLFTQINRYERALRSLLIMNGSKDADMLDFFNHMINKRGSDKDKERRKEIYGQQIDEFNDPKEEALRAKVEEFQTFYLKDLIGLANWKMRLGLKNEPNDVRRAVMHSRDGVAMRDARSPDYIFDSKSFEAFFNSAQALFNDSRLVMNRLNIQQSLENTAGSMME